MSYSCSSVSSLLVKISYSSSSDSFFFSYYLSLIIVFFCFVLISIYLLFPFSSLLLYLSFELYSVDRWRIWKTDSLFWLKVMLPYMKGLLSSESSTFMVFTARSHCVFFRFIAFLIHLVALLLTVSSWCMISCLLLYSLLDEDCLVLLASLQTVLIFNVQGCFKVWIGLLVISCYWSWYGSDTCLKWFGVISAWRLCSTAVWYQVMSESFSCKLVVVVV